MTSSRDTFARIRDELTKNRPGNSADAAIDWLTYLIGIIPGVGAASQIGNKIINDQRLKLQFDQLTERIERVATNIATLETGLARVSAIASAAASREEFQSAIADFLEAVKRDPSEFNVITTDWSRQDILNAIIEAERVLVSAVNNSTNLMRNTKVKAQRTDLRAHGNSYNVVDGTSFTDDKGSVSMHGITQAGDIQVTGNSVGFGEGGALIFGPPPDLLTGQCPFCGTTIQVRKAQLQGYSQIRCHACQRNIPFQLP